MATQTAPCPAALTHLRPTDRHGLTVVALAVASTAGAVWLSRDGGWMRWLAGQAILGAALVHWFVVLHECGHGTLFRGRRLNLAAGLVAGFMTMIPYRSWTRVHGRHHRWTGWQDLDPTTESLVPRPLGRIERRAVNICWRLWIPLFSTTYRIQNYWNLRRLFALFPRHEDRQRMGSNAVIQIAAYVALVIAVGPSALFRVAALGILISLAIEDLLLLSQHTHIPQHVSRGEAVEPFPAIEQEVFTRSLSLPGWISALFLHFDAHELHHMYPFVPGRHLRRIPYRPSHEVSWWEWVRASKRLGGVVLLFENSRSTGIQI
jgi:fatty acid desaturase